MTKMKCPECGAMIGMPADRMEGGTKHTNTERKFGVAEKNKKVKDLMTAK